MPVGPHAKSVAGGYLSLAAAEETLFLFHSAPVRMLFHVQFYAFGRVAVFGFGRVAVFGFGDDFQLYRLFFCIPALSLSES